MPEDRATLPHIHLVGFAGPTRDVAADPVAEPLRRVLQSLRDRISGEWLGLCTASSGAALLFTEELRSLGIPWHVNLPCTRAELVRLASAGDRRRLVAMVEAAERVTLVSAATTIEEAELDCTLEVVNACDVLVALWDDALLETGGTLAAVVAYARHRGRPLVLIHPLSGAVSRERCERITAEDSLLNYLNALPAAAVAAPATDIRERVALFQAKVSATAAHGAPRFRLLTGVALLCQLLATVVGGAAIAFDWHSAAVVWSKLLLLIGALAAVRVARHVRASESWIRCRLAAELCRTTLASWGLPGRTAALADLEIPGARQLLRSLDLLHSRGARVCRPTLDEFRSSYGEQRLARQLQYFRQRLARAEPVVAALRIGFTLSTLLAILCTAGYAVERSLPVNRLGSTIESVVFHFLPVLLPAISAGLVALVSINDLNRRVARYREMCALLEDAQQELAVIGTWHGLERLVRHVERILLHEVLEWYAVMRYRDAR
jgi:hypothetical protein